MSYLFKNSEPDPENDAENWLYLLVLLTVITIGIIIFLPVLL